MITKNFEDYEVLKILGTKTYKVQTKDTGKIFLWKAITFEESAKLQAVVENIQQQKNNLHPRLLQVHDYIVKEDIGVIYVIAEYLPNGNLNTIIQRCLNKNQYLHEPFLWKVLYQIAHTLKIFPTIYLDLSNIFIDSEFNVKILDDKEKETESNIGEIMHQLCTLTLHRNDAQIGNYYTPEFNKIIKFIRSSVHSTKEVVEVILCHPTILHNSNHIPHIYMQNTETTAVSENISNHETENTFRTRLKNLRNHERALRILEDNLCFKEHELKKREKKLAIMERTVKDKLLHAEVYLKRCKENKSSIKSSTKKYDDLDSTLCESLIEVTCKKINPNNVKRPSNFTRSLSQRRVQFKGHSPLKEKFGKDVYDVPSKKKLELPSSNKNKSLSEQNIDKGLQDCRPISWCEGTKQQAFELLRVINNKENPAVKHTYL
ncbi:hypothetical protein FQR65_LT14193 [Abscondita terminalis]|nr:hypothetical protein FQR65_LT14193 [Abscondita terminalis]